MAKRKTYTKKQRRLMKRYNMSPFDAVIKGSLYTAQGVLKADVKGKKRKLSSKKQASLLRELF